MTALLEPAIELDTSTRSVDSEPRLGRVPANLPADDTDEFLAGIEKHRDSFYRFLRRTLWDQGTVDDVFSSAVLSAYENRGKYTPGSNFRAWMFRILLNKCFIANRETKRRPEPLDSFLEVYTGPVQAAPIDVLDEPMKILDACGDEVYRALRTLSTAQRACIMLRGIERYSYREIAEILEIPTATVMTHLSRGRAKLRGELREYALERGLVRSSQNLRAPSKVGRAPVQPSESFREVASLTKNNF